MGRRNAAEGHVLVRAPLSTMPHKTTTLVLALAFLPLPMATAGHEVGHLPGPVEIDDLGVSFESDRGTATFWRNGPDGGCFYAGRFESYGGEAGPAGELTRRFAFAGATLYVRCPRAMAFEVEATWNEAWRHFVVDDVDSLGCHVTGTLSSRIDPVWGLYHEGDLEFGNGCLDPHVLHVAFSRDFLPPPLE